MLERDVSDDGTPVFAPRSNMTDDIPIALGIARSLTRTPFSLNIKCARLTLPDDKADGAHRPTRTRLEGLTSLDRARGMAVAVGVDVAAEEEAVEEVVEVAGEAAEAEAVREDRASLAEGIGTRRGRGVTIGRWARWAPSDLIVVRKDEDETRQRGLTL